MWPTLTLPQPFEGTGSHSRGDDRGQGIDCSLENRGRADELRLIGDKTSLTFRQVNAGHMCSADDIYDCKITADLSSGAFQSLYV